MTKPKITHRMTTFYVRGKGAFPIDMLRYDSCVPARGEDASAIDQQHWTSEERTIKLNRFSQDGGPPTTDRWRSFMWGVYTEAEISAELGKAAAIAARAWRQDNLK